MSWCSWCLSYADVCREELLVEKKVLLICKNRKLMKLIRLIASPMLMYVLAGVYALVLAIATLWKNSSGPTVARIIALLLSWFILLQLLQAVNLLAMFLQGGYFKRISKGSLIFMGLCFIWLGAAVTHYAGVTGICTSVRGNGGPMMRDEGQDGKCLPAFFCHPRRFPVKALSGSSQSDVLWKRSGDKEGRMELLCRLPVRMNKVIEVDGYRLFLVFVRSDWAGNGVVRS